MSFGANDMMEFQRHQQDPDEYLTTALQIFDYCGSESSGTLRVDDLMEKFAPFIKTNKAEYSHLRSLLDPERVNPEINVTRLAFVLNKYSENQKIKVDLDESFNLSKSGPIQDSDSGISGDGFHYLEELQCELKEKTHTEQQLRRQLELHELHHEEALAVVIAERDSLLAHLNMLRDENMTLTNMRREHEETSDRLCASEEALNETKRDLEACKKKTRVLVEQVSCLETEKLTLQELLSKSKDECHRINEMYASRQSALLEENETLKTEHAELTAKLQDQEEFMQQIIKEKVSLEMELKELLNKTNQTQIRMDRSIDVSFIEDLTALDSINADTRFELESPAFEEDFMDKLIARQRRLTNVSLFDEIRLSMSSMSKPNTSLTADDSKELLDSSSIGTQTNETFKFNVNNNSLEDCKECKKAFSNAEAQVNLNINFAAVNIETQTYDRYTCDDGIKENCKVTEEFDTETQTKCVKVRNGELTVTKLTDGNCQECDRLKKYAADLETDLNTAKLTLNNMNIELVEYENNLEVLSKSVEDGNKKNGLLQVIIDILQEKFAALEEACSKQKETLDQMNCETCCAECQTDFDQVSVSTQTDVPCVQCEKHKLAAQRGVRKFLRDCLKSLVQIFAVVCFFCAVMVLYNVTRRWHSRCGPLTSRVPWGWLHAQDLMDFLLRIEYANDVPM